MNRMKTIVRNMPRPARGRVRGAAWIVALVLAGSPRLASGNDADERLADYLARVKASSESQSSSPGSLWTPYGPFAGMAVDYKARNVNDLIMIHIIEQTRAEAAGSVQANRDFDAASGISELFGPLGPRSGLAGLFAPFAESSLQGQAQTAANSRLSTTLSGHVEAVLPNGNMVIRAAREVAMNNERQTLIIRGVVRSGDVSPDNSVLSTQLSHLEIHLEGNGVISSAVRPPNRLMRALLRIFGF